jgi:multidrug efflux system outer membrane protein
MPKRIFFLLINLLPLYVEAQNNKDIAGQDTTLTLTQCLQYAMKHQPALKQSYIDEQIADANNRIAYSAWLPQITGLANYNHYYQLPTVFFPSTATTAGSPPVGTLVAAHTGLHNTSIPELAANQVIFSPEVLIAVRTGHLNTLYAKQTTTSTKIELISDVSKSFYDLLLSLQQINVLREDTSRLIKNQSDTYHQYVSGVKDKVDYKQATISLNNSLAQLKNTIESAHAKFANLKQLMGYPTDKIFNLNFDTARMMQEVFFDTTEQLDFNKRIEYQQLETARRLQKETTSYYQIGFLPSISAFYNYDLEYENNTVPSLFNKSYPYSLWGLNLSIPIFTGFRRTENVRKAKLNEQRTDWDRVNLELSIYTEYKQALANYTSNLYNLHAMSDNVQLATEVYNIVKLQYREGIKAYLDVITAETDLRNSEINYLNALFQLLGSKVDLQKAMGDITPNI